MTMTTTMTTVRAGGLAMLLGGLAACGDSEPQDLGAVYDDRFEAAIDLGYRIDETFATTEENMPTSGQARFEGSTVVGVGIPGSIGQSALIGDTTLTADFGAGTLEGSATDFVGTVRGAPVEAFDGALTMADGQIDGNLALGVMQGTLVSDENRVEVASVVSGQFDGNPEPLVLGLQSGDTLVSVNGSVDIGSVLVVTERD